MPLTLLLPFGSQKVNIYWFSECIITLTNYHDGNKFNVEFIIIVFKNMKKERIWSYAKETTPHLRNKPKNNLNNFNF